MSNLEKAFLAALREEGLIKEAHDFAKEAKKKGGKRHGRFIHSKAR